MEVNSRSDSQIDMLAASQDVAARTAANDLNIQILAELKSLGDSYGTTDGSERGR